MEDNIPIDIAVDAIAHVSDLPKGKVEKFLRHFTSLDPSITITRDELKDEVMNFFATIGPDRMGQVNASIKAQRAVEYALEAVRRRMRGEEMVANKQHEFEKKLQTKYKMEELKQKNQKDDRSTWVKRNDEHGHQSKKAA